MTTSVINTLHFKDFEQQKEDKHIYRKQPFNESDVKTLELSLLLRFTQVHRCIIIVTLYHFSTERVSRNSVR